MVAPGSRRALVIFGQARFMGVFLGNRVVVCVKGCIYPFENITGEFSYNGLCGLGLVC